MLFNINQFNYFPARGEVCPLFITFLNSLDQNQTRQNIMLDLDPNCLTLRKSYIEIKSAEDKRAYKITQDAKCIAISDGGGGGGLGQVLKTLENLPYQFQFLLCGYLHYLVA